MTSQVPIIGKLLDTNAVIAFINQSAPINAITSPNIIIYIASITLGELRFGAYKSSQVNSNLARVDKFADGRIVLACDALTADYYAKIRNQLRIKGRPIPQNDAWIAALAMQHSLILVTRDQHFEPIDALRLEKW